MPSFLDQLLGNSKPPVNALAGPHPDAPPDPPAELVDQDDDKSGVGTLAEPMGFTNHDHGDEAGRRDAEGQHGPPSGVIPQAVRKILSRVFTREMPADDFVADEITVGAKPAQLGGDPQQIGLTLVNTGGTDARFSRNPSFVPTDDRGSFPLDAGATIDLDVSCPVYVAADVDITSSSTTTVAVFVRLDRRL